jgi:molybdenum cofactor biosynthesis enzyme MoaA
MDAPNMKIDEKFRNHFKNLKQVFLYLTDECNLRCVHCLYKPNLLFHNTEKQIKLETALDLLSNFRKMGASKLTLMGGEPTLYGKSAGYAPLFKLIKESKELGYEYIRIDTNGQFQKSLLQNEDFHKIDEISFGLDGYTSAINDQLRGKGAFQKCVSNIKESVKLGYKVDITTCIHKGLSGRDTNKKLALDEMILFASSLGINRINFHDLFKTGIPRDSWTGNVDISFLEWQEIYEEIHANIKNEKYSIPVRLPRCFISHEEFESNSDYFGYCPAKLGERVLVHPNGIIRICSLMIGTPYGVARYYDNKIVWDDSPTNELNNFDLKNNTPCSNQNNQKFQGNNVALCVSFKPNQKEFIWQEKLSWEKKNIVNH